jgi:putative GTP pyrophosphokinase
MDEDRISAILGQYDSATIVNKSFGAEVKRILQAILEAEKLSVNSVTCRFKGRDSLELKIIGDEKYKRLEDVTDVVGARVVTNFEDEVDSVRDIIHRNDNFDIDEANSIDKRRQLGPDQLGYQSLHLVAWLSEKRLQLPENQQFKGLKVEIQIRSILQHAWAEIEHKYYKNEAALPLAIRRFPERS